MCLTNLSAKRMSNRKVVYQKNGERNGKKILASSFLRFCEINDGLVFRNVYVSKCLRMFTFFFGLNIQKNKFTKNRIHSSIDCQSTDSCLNSHDEINEIYSLDKHTIADGWLRELLIRNKIQSFGSGWS